MRNNIEIKSFSGRSFYSVLRWFVLIVLIVMLTIIAIMQVQTNYKSLLIFVIIESLLLCSNIFKLFIIQNANTKLWLYITDSMLILLLLILSKSSYIITLYVIILSEFYYCSNSNKERFSMATVSFALYVLCFVLVNCLLGDMGTSVLITQMLNDFIVFALHFIIFNLAVALYRRNKVIEKNLLDLEQSNENLKRAYEKLEEVTVLEERNRISKEIHDIAGHSITAVIMQTEAAKLLFDKDPAVAKEKIVYANLQAKNALQELRDSVHSLSGKPKNQSLKMYLESVITSFGISCDVNVRYDIDEVTVSEEKESCVVSMLKEGLSNGIRHGKSTAFYFELKEDEGVINIILSDNGKGNPKNTFTEGFGLSKMRQSVERLSGKVEFTMENDEGFEIKVKLPVENC